MLVARVHVSFGAQLSDAVEMMNVHVNEYSEEAVEQLLADGQEVLGKRRSHGDGEHALVVYLLLDPVHEQPDVLGRGQMRRLLVVLRVLPKVLVLGTARHDRTRLHGAILGDDAIHEINTIEEVNNMHGDPVVELLVFG